jgi:hypothetical protein
VKEPIAIVFFPENVPTPPAIQQWQARNPDWRRPVDDVIICPVCGIAVRAIADYALLDADDVRRDVTRFRDEHLRAACSDHYFPRQEDWAVLESRGW